MKQQTRELYADRAKHGVGIREILKEGATPEGEVNQNTGTRNESSRRRCRVKSRSLWHGPRVHEFVRFRPTLVEGFRSTQKRCYIECRPQSHSTTDLRRGSRQHAMYRLVHPREQHHRKAGRHPSTKHGRMKTHQSKWRAVREALHHETSRVADCTPIYVRQVRGRSPPQNPNGEKRSQAKQSTNAGYSQKKMKRIHPGE